MARTGELHGAWSRRVAAATALALAASVCTTTAAGAAESTISLTSFTADPVTVTVDGADGTALEDLRTLFLPASQGGGSTTIDSAALARIALARIDLQHSALARIALARIALARIDVGNPALNQVLLSQIPLHNEEWSSWEEFLAGTTFAGAPLQTISLLQVLKSTDPLIVTRLATLDLGSLDLTGTVLASLPLASLLLAGAPLGDIPVDEVNGVPVTGEDAWCTELQDLLDDRELDCADLGLDGVADANDGSLMSAALAGVPLESVALARIALEDIPESALDPETSPLASIKIAQSDLESSALARIALARISTDPQASALARIALARIDLEHSALARIALARIRIQDSALARIKLSDIAIQDTALARIALARIDTAVGSALDGVLLATLPVEGTALAGIPLTRANLAGPLGDTLLSNIGVVGPIADIPLGKLGTSSLRDLLLADLDLSSLGLTLGDLEATFGTCGPDPEPLPCNTPLDDLDLGTLTLGDLVDDPGAASIATTPLGDVIPTGFAASNLGGTLGQLVTSLGYLATEEPLAGTLDDLDLGTGDLVGTLAGLLRTMPLATLEAVGLDTLGGILALVPGLDADLGDLILALDDDDLEDATLGDLLPFLLVPIEGSVAELLASVNDVDDLDLGTLGELLALVIGGDIDDLGTLADLLRNLTGDTGLTLADVILFLLSPTEFDWEALTLDAADLAAIKLAGARVHYTAVVDVTCGDAGCPNGHLLQVTLPDGFSFAGEVEGAELVAVDGQVLTFALDDVTASGPLTVELDVNPVIGNDALATAQLLDPTPAPVGDPLTAEVDVAAGPDPAPGTPAAPRALAADRLYLGALSSSDDVHYWSVQIGTPGERLSLFLGNLHEDYDLVLYSPEGADAVAPLRGAASERTLPLDTNPISLDPLSDAAGTEPREDLPLLDDRTPFAIAAERQGAGVGSKEVIETGPLEVGTYLIQVSGYNGAFTDVPYTLRAAIGDPPDLGDCTARAWPNPPSSFGAASTDIPDDATALFLVNRQRLAATYGEAEADSVLDAIDDLITEQPNGLVAGVLALDSVDDINDAYSAWDGAANRCEPQAANDVVRAIGDALDEVDAPIEHLVVVGADDIIPFSRVRDATTIANEQDYAAAFAANSELASALARGYVLTDDPLADPTPVATAGRELFVPELGIGRLVEEPDDIVGALGDFVDAEGLLAADTAFTSGYEFLTDGATAAGNALANPSGDGTDERSLNEELRGDFPGTDSAWTDEHLRQLVFDKDEPADLLSLNAHFDHSRLLPGLGSAEGAENQLVTIGDVADTLAGSLLFSMGCHSGLSVAASAGGADEEDWAETFVRNGALWVGNTGFGYGDTDVIALSEQLMVNFATNLDGAVPVGTALADAKQQYLADLGVISPYDEKALMQTTLFGLPMYELADPQPASPPPHTPPTLAAVPGAPGLQQAVVNEHGISFTPSTTSADGAVPKYWSVGGRIQATQYRPIQPRMTVDVTPSDEARVVRGALVTDLVSNDVLTRPHIFRPVVHNSDKEQAPVIGDSAFPGAIQSVSTFESRQGTRQQLVLVPGQFRTSSEGNVAFGTQRLYSSVDTLVYYGSTTDEALGPPATIEFADGAHVGVSAAFVVETDRPASDILRTYVLYTAEGMGGAWEGLDLAFEDGRWTGNELLPNGIAPDAGIDYIVQVVTTDGQVSITSNKGRFFEAVTPEQSGPIAFNTTSTSSGGWYRDPDLRFTLTAPANMLNLEYSVDGAAFQPYTGASFPVTGDGLHRLRARNAGDPGSASSLVVPIDTRFPNQGPRDPDVTPDPTDGWNGPDVPTVTFFRDGDQGSISSGADTVSYTATGAQPTTETQTAHDESISTPVSAEGVTTFTYWSTDRAGNDNPSKAFDVRYDKTKPVVAAPTFSGAPSGAHTPAASKWLNYVPTSTINVSDPLPGGGDDPWDQSSRLRRVDISWTGATTGSAVRTLPSSPSFPQTYVLTLTPAELDLREGKTQITVTATDVAGNVSTQRVYELWYDATVSKLTFSPGAFDPNLRATTTYGPAANKPYGLFEPTPEPATPGHPCPVSPTWPCKGYPAGGITNYSLPTYLLNSTVTVPYTCADPVPGPPSTSTDRSGIAACTSYPASAVSPQGSLSVNRSFTLSPTSTSGASFRTNSVGVQTIAFAVTDVAGNLYLETFTYRVVYKVELLYDQTKAGKSGSTSPIKVKLRDANNVDVSSASITLTALEIRSGGAAASSPGNANPGGTFKWDSKAKLYQFNAKPTIAKGTYGLAFQTSTEPGPGAASQRFIGPWTPYRAEFKIG